YAANLSWARYMRTYLMTSPEILAGVGILEKPDDVSITVDGRDGRRLEKRLVPLPLERSDQPFEAWWDLSPTHPGRQGPWVSALPTEFTRLPLYLKQLTRYYWAEGVK